MYAQITRYIQFAILGIVWRNTKTKKELYQLRYFYYIVRNVEMQPFIRIQSQIYTPIPKPSGYILL